MGNAGVLQFFGNNDIETLEYISRRLGKTTITVERRGAEITHDQRLEGLSGRTRGEELHDLITPDEAARFFRRDDAKSRQLIIHAGYPAAVMQRFTYYEDNLFRGRYDVLE
jgi:type IV secretion system protein VirD4